METWIKKRKKQKAVEVLNTRCSNGSTIRASCCHDVTNKLALCITIKETTIDYDRECFVNCLCYTVVCFPCFLKYLGRGDILFTEKQEQDWLHQE
jgi:hypothetical protein